jgi:hypothetical protein
MSVTKFKNGFFNELNKIILCEPLTRYIKRYSQIECNFFFKRPPAFLKGKYVIF